MSQQNWYNLKEFHEEVLNKKICIAEVYALAKRGVIPTTAFGQRLLVPSWYVDKILNGAK